MPPRNARKKDRASKQKNASLQQSASQITTQAEQPEVKQQSVPVSTASSSSDETKSTEFGVMALKIGPFSTYCWQPPIFPLALVPIVNEVSLVEAKNPQRSLIQSELKEVEAFQQKAREDKDVLKKYTQEKILDLARAHNTVACLLLRGKKEDIKEAITYFTEGSRLFKSLHADLETYKKIGKNIFDLAVYYFNTGVACYQNGDYGNANKAMIETHSQIKKINELLALPKHIFLIAILQRHYLIVHGIVFFRLNNFSQARLLFEEFRSKKDLIGSKIKNTRLNLVALLTMAKMDRAEERFDIDLHIELFAALQAQFKSAEIIDQIFYVAAMLMRAFAIKKDTTRALHYGKHAETCFVGRPESKQKNFNSARFYYEYAKVLKDIDVDNAVLNYKRVLEFPAPEEKSTVVAYHQLLSQAAYDLMQHAKNKKVNVDIARYVQNFISRQNQIPATGRTEKDWLYISEVCLEQARLLLSGSSVKNAIAWLRTAIHLLKCSLVKKAEPPANQCREQIHKECLQAMEIACETLGNPQLVQHLRAKKFHLSACTCTTLPTEIKVDELASEYLIDQCAKACCDSEVNIAHLILKLKYSEEDEAKALSEQVIKWLETEGTTLPDWQFVFNECCRFNIIHLMHYFLSKNFNVNYVSSEGDSPLTITIFYENKDACELLIRARADVNVREEKDAQVKRKIPLIEAAKKGRLDLVQALLTPDVNINCHDEDKCTPLMHVLDAGYQASDKGDIEQYRALVELFVSRGASLEGTERIVPPNTNNLIFKQLQIMKIKRLIAARVLLQLNSFLPETVISQFFLSFIKGFTGHDEIVVDAFAILQAFNLDAQTKLPKIKDQFIVINFFMFANVIDKIIVRILFYRSKSSPQEILVAAARDVFKEIYLHYYYEQVVKPKVQSLKNRFVILKDKVELYKLKNERLKTILNDISRLDSSSATEPWKNSSSLKIESFKTFHQNYQTLVLQLDFTDQQVLEFESLLFINLEKGLRQSGPLFKKLKRLLKEYEKRLQEDISALEPRDHVLSVFEFDLEKLKKPLSNSNKKPASSSSLSSSPQPTKPPPTASLRSPARVMAALKQRPENKQKNIPATPNVCTALVRVRIRLSGMLQHRVDDLEFSFEKAQKYVVQSSLEDLVTASLDLAGNCASVLQEIIVLDRNYQKCYCLPFAAANSLRNYLWRDELFEEFKELEGNQLAYQEIYKLAEYLLSMAQNLNGEIPSVKEIENALVGKFKLALYRTYREMTDDDINREILIFNTQSKILERATKIERLQYHYRGATLFRYARLKAITGNKVVVATGISASKARHPKNKELPSREEAKNINSMQIVPFGQQFKAVPKKREELVRFNTNAFFGSAPTRQSISSRADPKIVADSSSQKLPENLGQTSNQITREETKLEDLRPGSNDSAGRSVSQSSQPTAHPNRTAKLPRRHEVIKLPARMERTAFNFHLFHLVTYCTAGIITGQERVDEAIIGFPADPRDLPDVPVFDEVGRCVY